MRTKLFLYMINLQLVYMYIDLLRFFFVFFGLTRSIELIRMGHWHRCLKKKTKKHLFAFHCRSIAVYIGNPAEFLKLFNLNSFFNN